MKKAFLIAAVFLFGCEKDKLLTYDAGENIYFQYKVGVDSTSNSLGTLTDTLDYTFAYSPASVEDTLFPIPIAVTGDPVATDRAYKVVADAGGTAKEGQHYEWPSLVIHAGRVKDTLFLRFKRSADLQHGQVNMTIRLQPNDNFNTDLPFMLAHDIDTIPVTSLYIRLSDILTAGADWDGFYGTYFGDFSEKKVRLMNEIVGLPLDFWIKPAYSSEQIAGATYYATAMGRYLRQQAMAGNIIYEEDGVTQMKMGTNYQ
jgi:hypothetical protein